MIDLYTLLNKTVDEMQEFSIDSTLEQSYLIELVYQYYDGHAIGVLLLVPYNRQR